MVSALKMILVCYLFCVSYLHVTDASNVDFTSKNWDLMLEGEWLVKFYAPWCPACRAIEGTWNELATWVKSGKDGVYVGSCDVTAQPALNGRFMVTALPTIYHIKDGVFRPYKGGRALEDFQKLVEEEEWKDIEPMSSWINPNSVAMDSLSKLFEFSLAVKDFHESLSNEYGVPGWLSLLLFGLIIIVIGLVLGILLVLATDYIWGPPAQPTYGERKKQDIPEEDDPVKEDVNNDSGETVKKDASNDSNDSVKEDVSHDSGDHKDKDLDEKENADKKDKIETGYDIIDNKKEIPEAENVVSIEKSEKQIEQNKDKVSATEANETPDLKEDDVKKDGQLKKEDITDKKETPTIVENKNEKKEVADPQKDEKVNSSNEKEDLNE